MEAISVVSKLFIRALSFVLLWAYYRTVIFYEGSLFSLSLPALITLLFTASLAVVLWLKQPLWYKHPLLVNAGWITGFAIGLFIPMVIFFQ